VEPLLTRHVFLDTQVFNALKHNPSSPALLALKEHIDAHRVVLHITDITFLEVNRQLTEAVLYRVREIAKAEKDFRRWRKQAPNSAPAPMSEFDANAMAVELFLRFRTFITRECRAEVPKLSRLVPN